jgi:hypothetical protein
VFYELITFEKQFILTALTFLSRFIILVKSIYENICSNIYIKDLFTVLAAPSGDGQ